MPKISLRKRANQAGRAFARLVLIIIFVIYSAAKFTGAQFVIPGYLLDTPVADLSGMDLTWAFFSHSPLYGGFIAVGQLIAASLLAFDRTTRLGTFLLLPITVNVAFVNIGYKIGDDTLVLSMVLLALNVYLLADELPALKKCFWDETASDVPSKLFSSQKAAVFARGVCFLVIVVGIFCLFTSIMNGPAGGQKAIAGEWSVESAVIDDRPEADITLGADWLWICFDPYGRFSIRTKRHTLHGKYSADPVSNHFEARYDTEPLPPIYPGQSIEKLNLTPTEMIRVIGEQHGDFKWPVELMGTYQKENQKLIITTMRGNQRITWILTPYKRPKF